jgi:hypothetical protein
VPRPSPFTQADIKARSRLTGLPKDAGQPEEVPSPMRRGARGWDFSAAIDTLGLRHKDRRARCENELILICINNKLARLAEEQETPGRKARALQLAPRVARKLDLLAKEGRKALWLKQRELWLPQSLEHQAARALAIHLNETVEEELDHIPRSRNDFAPLKEQMMRQTRKGCYESSALGITIHALQVCAVAWNPKLIWDKNRRAPPKQLLRFLVQVLRAAGIDHPNPQDNYSKFVALMLRPSKPTGRQVERPPEQPPSEAERRLSKVFL